MSDADSPPLTPDGIAHDWWSGLTTGREPQSCGTLARLRRASTPLDITMIPASLTLMRRLRGFDADPRRHPRRGTGTRNQRHLRVAAADPGAGQRSS